MAKNKDAAFDSFLADLKAINPQIEEILKDERVSTKLRTGVLAQSDYSSKMDELRQERENLNAYLQEQKKNVEGWKNWYDGATREVADMQTKLQTYEAEYGSLDGTNRRSYVAPEDVDKKMAEEFQRRETAYIKFMDDLSDLKLEHRDRFKEKLDTQAVLAISAERKLPLDVAYEIHVADKREALRQSEFEEKLKAARLEGAQEALSKHKLPMLDSTPSYHGTHVNDAQPLSQADRIKAATEAFMQKR